MKTREELFEEYCELLRLREYCLQKFGKAPPVHRIIPEFDAELESERPN